MGTSTKQLYTRATLDLLIQSCYADREFTIVEADNLRRAAIRLGILAQPEWDAMVATLGSVGIYSSTTMVQWLGSKAKVCRKALDDDMPENGAVLTHPVMKALDPPGSFVRRWACGLCGAEAQGLGALNKLPCDAPPLTPEETDDLVILAIEDPGEF